MNNSERIVSISKKSLLYQETYLYNGAVYQTLAVAKSNAEYESKTTVLKVIRFLDAEFCKVWYGYISYGAQKYNWVERIEKI